MHKLGNDSMTANDKKRNQGGTYGKAKPLQFRCCTFGVRQCICIEYKFALERLTFSSHTVPFVGAGAVKKQIDETDIMLYLETFMRIYVKPESIVIDRQNDICKIRLNGKTTANIRIKNGTSVKSILFQSE